MLTMHERLCIDEFFSVQKILQKICSCFKVALPPKFAASLSVDVTFYPK